MLLPIPTRLPGHDECVRDTRPRGNERLRCASTRITTLPTGNNRKAVAALPRKVASARLLTSEFGEVLADLVADLPLPESHGLSPRLSFRPAKNWAAEYDASRRDWRSGQRPRPLACLPPDEIFRRTCGCARWSWSARRSEHEIIFRPEARAAPECENGGPARDLPRYPRNINIQHFTRLCLCSPLAQGLLFRTEESGGNAR